MAVVMIAVVIVLLVVDVMIGTATVTVVVAMNEMMVVKVDNGKEGEYSALITLSTKPAGKR